MKTISKSIFSVLFLWVTVCPSFASETEPTLEEIKPTLKMTFSEGHFQVVSDEAIPNTTIIFHDETVVLPKGITFSITRDGKSAFIRDTILGEITWPQDAYGAFTPPRADKVIITLKLDRSKCYQGHAEICFTMKTGSELIYIPLEPPFLQEYLNRYMLRSAYVRDANKIQTKVRMGQHIMSLPGPTREGELLLRGTEHVPGQGEFDATLFYEPRTQTIRYGNGLGEPREKINITEGSVQSGRFSYVVADDIRDIRNGKVSYVQKRTMEVQIIFGNPKIQFEVRERRRERQ